MKSRKSAWFVTFLGVLLVLSFVILGNALVAECTFLNGSCAFQKVLVSVKTQIDRDGRNLFSLDDIRRLKDKLETKDISFTAQSGYANTYASNGGADAAVSLTGTDCLYPLFNNITLTEGSFFTAKHEEEGVMVAVIDEELAWMLFKTKNAAGRTVEIYDSVFRVIGVAEKNDSILGKLTDDGLPDIYIPASVMLELDDTARITDMQIKTEQSDTLDQNTDAVSLALAETGKNISGYYITDYNLKQALMEQKPFILVFILGIAGAVMLLARIKNIIVRMCVQIRNGCRTDYFPNVVKNNRTEFMRSAFEAVLASAGIVFILSAAGFNLYIPVSYIPDELIDFSYYSDLIQSLIAGGLQSRGYVAPYAELAYNTANSALNILFVTSLVPGLLILYSGFRELKPAEIDISRLTLIVGIFFAVSVLILTLAAYFAGLPVTMALKSNLVVWMFLFIKCSKTPDSRSGG